MAAVLDASVASVNSALQRARAKLAIQDLDARPVAKTDDHQRNLLERYVRAWESGDLKHFVALLKEDATYSTQPWRAWYQGRRSLRDFFETDWPAYRCFRLLPVGANLQPAFALYSLGAESRWNAHSIQLLALDQSGVRTITMSMQRLSQTRLATFQLPPVLEA